MDFTLVNVYNRPGSGNKAVGSLLQVVPAITNIAVVQGDFNLHSPLWDDRVSRGSGLATELFNTLSDCSLNLVNDEGDPTWTNGRGSSSVIDLLFCNDRLVALDPSLDVSLHDRGHSDHALISLIFGRQILRPGRPFITKDSEEEHHFFVSYHHHPHSLSTLPPSSAFSDPPFLSADNTSTVPPVEPWLQAIPGRLCGINRPPRRQNFLPGLLRPRSLSPPLLPPPSPRFLQLLCSPLHCRHCLLVFARAPLPRRISGTITPAPAGRLITTSTVTRWVAAMMPTRTPA
jgi:hypothetical protein